MSTTRSCLPRRALLGLLLGLLWWPAAAPIPSAAQVNPAFQAPDLQQVAFRTSQLSLDPETCRRLATLLATHVSYWGDPALDAKLLGVALRLDPTNRVGREAYELRGKNVVPEIAKKPHLFPSTPRPQAAAYLANLCRGLRNHGGPDNLFLRACLLDVAQSLDAHNLTVETEVEAPLPAGAPAGSAAVNWSFLRARGFGAAGGPDLGAAPTLARNQSKLRGLMVSQLPSGEEAGSTSDIIVTVEDLQGPSREGQCAFVANQTIGPDMTKVLDEAFRALRLRYPHLGDGKRLVFSFAEKYVSKDGPSAGAAFALLIHSLYDKAKLAGDCALTGDITVDGKVQKVGGVPTKIHAAILDHIAYVGIPKGNAYAVLDGALLYDPSFLWQTQIFTVDTFDEALAVMREDRSEKLLRASRLFGEVQRQLGKNTTVFTAAHRALIPTLEEILRAAPNHASADVLLKLLRGQVTNTLSLYTSLEEITSTGHNALALAVPREGHPEMNPRALVDGIGKLERIRPLVDHRTAEALSRWVDVLQAAVHLNPHEPGALANQEFDARYATLAETWNRMIANPVIFEELRR